jgi:hypothetical protein
VNDRLWEHEVERLKEEGLEVPERPEEVTEPVRPDWGSSPLEVRTPPGKRFHKI